MYVLGSQRKPICMVCMRAYLGLCERERERERERESVYVYMYVCVCARARALFSALRHHTIHISIVNVC